MMIKGTFKSIGLILSIGVSIVVMSCENFLDVEPPKNELASETVFLQDETAIAAIRGIYADLYNEAQGFAGGGTNSVFAMAGLSSDELIYNLTSYPTLSDFANNNLKSDNVVVYTNWSKIYKIIYECNAAIEGLKETTSLTEVLRRQLLGEALFIRAFSYFYLVNMFGDVPLTTTTKYPVNAALIRTDAAAVYSQIIQDLNEAKIFLREDYSFNNGEKTRVVKQCASALLARTYLFNQQWTNAESEATEVIASNLYGLEANLGDVFHANSNEAIWQLFTVKQVFEAGSTIDTYEGRLLIPLPEGYGFTPEYNLSLELLNDFEPADKRLTDWTGQTVIYGITYNYPHKYTISYRSVFGNPPYKEYSMVLRLAEQYLIRAEAKAHQGNITGAQEDVNIIRSRAGLPNTTANDQASLLLAVEQERRVELFTEWGHRWFDLNRTNRSDQVLGAIKQDWQPTDKLYPIPSTERIANPNLTQNLGY